MNDVLLCFTVIFSIGLVTLVILFVCKRGYFTSCMQASEAAEAERRQFERNNELVAAHYRRRAANYTEEDDEFLASQIFSHPAPSSLLPSPFSFTTAYQLPGPSRPAPAHLEPPVSNEQRPPLPLPDIEIIKTPHDRDGICVICLDDLTKDAENSDVTPPIKAMTLAALPCQHVMHENCLRKWLAKDPQRSCPVCRIPSSPLSQSARSSSATVNNDDSNAFIDV